MVQGGQWGWGDEAEQGSIQIKEALGCGEGNTDPELSSLFFGLSSAPSSWATAWRQ